MKKHACFAGLLLFFSPVSAQLTYENNRIVAGDEVTKQFISYKDSGRSGESCLWDFSEFSVQDGSYEVYYTGSSDTLLIAREHNTSYYYRLRGDSLLLQGLENRETLIRHKIPELLLRYPMAYGDSLGGYFHATGLYCDKLRLEEGGYVYTRADASGLLVLPSKDTLRNVLRTHTVKRFVEEHVPVVFSETKDSLQQIYPVTEDSIRYRLATDTLQMETQTFRWYAPGYRYPVFETVIHCEIAGLRCDTVFAASFFCSPNEQTYLNDSVNTALRDSLVQEAEGLREIPGAENPVLPGMKKKNRHPIDEVYYNFYPNPVKDVLQVEIYLPDPVGVEYAVYTLTGELVYRDRQDEAAGTVQREIDFSNRNRGEYLLYIKAGEKEISEKILRR